MENRSSQLNVTEMTWTLRHTFATRLALKISIYRSHPRIHQTTRLRLVRGLVQHLRKLDFCHGVRFLFKKCVVAE